MKKIYILLFALAAAVGMTGCTSEMPEKTADEDGDILIRLQVDGLETKSAGTSDENYVESLQLLIFKDINAAPAAYLTPSITPGGGPFNQSYTNAEALATGLTGENLKTATVFAVANCSTDLSSATSLANAKAVAVDAAAMVSNTSEGYKVNDSPRFVMTAEGGFEVGTGTDAGNAVANLTLKRLASKVSLTITYNQDLSDPDSPTLITTTNADGTTTVWTPMTEGNVRVYLQNAVSNATLGGFATSQTRFTYADVHPAGEPLTASAFYTYPPKWEKGSDDAPFIKIIQPWSYKTMKDGAAPGDPAKPVVVDESTVELYYKVMFPGMTELSGNTDYQFTVQLTVLGGESTRDMKEITPTGFSILPWGATTGSDLSPIVSETPKYLAVERESTVVNNGAGVSIKYVATGPATLTVNSIKKKVYSNTDMVDKYMYPADTDIADKYTGGTVAAGSSDAWFENSYGTDPKKPNEGTITLKHTLSSALFDETITNFAARPYEYDLMLHLDSESNSDLDQSFHITQNPPFLVTGEISTGYVIVDNQHSPFGSIYRKRTSSDALMTPTATDDFNAELGTSYYINPLYRNNLYDYDRLRKDKRLGNTYTYIDLTRNASTGDPQTSNLCEYRIIVSMAAVEGKFIVDPRVESSAEEDLDKIINKHKSGYSTTIATDNNYLDKDDNPLSTDATDISNIAKYKPTSKSEAAKNFIAPELMFASSYGRTGTLTYEEAVLRCLAYQEDGYPAGRWRLPTEAEISMCIQLQKRGTIPELFRTDVTLTGAYRYSGGYSASSGNRYIADSFKPYANAIFTVDGNDRAICAWPRCVYDTWYWGKEEEALKDGTYTEAGVNYQKYKWSGYGYTYKH